MDWSLASLKRKIETEIMAGLSEEQAIASIRDIIRYTAILDEQKFIEQYQRILHKLYEKFREPSVPQSEKEKIFLEMQQLVLILDNLKRLI